MDRPVLYFPGVFDLASHKHFTLCQYYKNKLPDAYLVVGVFSDQDALQVAGKVVMSAPEREQSMKACKWVDKVIRPCPRLYTIDYLRANDVSFVCVAGKLVPPQEALHCDIDYKSRYSELKATLAMAGRFIAKRSVYLATHRKDLDRDSRVEQQQAQLAALEAALVNSQPGPSVSLLPGLLASVKRVGKQLSQDVVTSFQQSLEWASSFF